MPNTTPPAFADAASPRTVNGVMVGERDTDRSFLDDEVDLSGYWRALRARWMLVAAGAAAGLLLAVALTVRQPIVYEAATTILVDRANSPTAISTSRALLQNYSLAEQTVNELGLNRPPGAITPQAFVNGALAIDEVRGTNLLRVKVTLPDPQRAAAASQLLATKAVALNREIVSEGSSALQSQLKVLLDESANRLKGAEQQFIAFQTDAQLDLLKTDTDALLDQRAALADLQVEIETEKARLRAAEQELQNQPPVLSLPRAVNAEEALRRALTPSEHEKPPAPNGRPSRVTAPTDTAGVEKDPGRTTDPSSAREGGRSDGGSAMSPQESPRVPSRSDRVSTREEAQPAPLDLSNPVVNPVYQTLAFQIATSRARLAALERQQRELKVVRKVDGDRLRQLSDLYRKRTEEQRLRDAYDVARRAHSDIASRYEQSRLQSIGETVQLQIVDPAIAPDRPLPRRRVQAAGLGLTAGALGAALLALALGAWAGETQRPRGLIAARNRP